MENSIFNTHPQIAQQFHPRLNGDLRVSSLTQGSNRRVWWLGECTHEWDTTVYQRTQQNQGCPICKGKRILVGFNDLSTTHPEVARQWHPTLNPDVQPTQVSKGSNKKFWWLGDCSHEWFASVLDRVNKNAGCPVCTNRLIVSGINDLSTTHSDLAGMWDYEKNKPSLNPNNVVAGNKNPFYWKCPKGHDWKGILAVESNKVDGYCMICRGKTIVSGSNDFATLYPTVAKTWDNMANKGKNPSGISPESHDKAWWVCPLSHSFERPIRDHVRNKGTCPYCSGRKCLQGFNDLMTLHPTIAKEWHPTKNPGMAPETTHPG